MAALAILSFAGIVRMLASPGEIERLADGFTEGIRALTQP